MRVLFAKPFDTPSVIRLGACRCFEHRRVPLLDFLFPPRPDASENLSGLLNIAACPEPHAHSPDVLQWRRFDRFGRDMPMQGDVCNA